MQMMKRQRQQTGRLRLWSILVAGGVAVLAAGVVLVRGRSRTAPVSGIRFEENVEIARPPEEVFAFVADPRNDAQWTPAIEEARKTSEGPPGVGTTYEQVGRFLGRRLQVPFEIVEYEANRKIAIRPTSGALQLTGKRTVEAVPGGTRLTIAAEGRTGGFFWLLPDQLFVLPARRQLRASLANLKDLLEARS